MKKTNEIIMVKSFSDKNTSQFSFQEQSLMPFKESQEEAQCNNDRFLVIQTNEVKIM